MSVKDYLTQAFDIHEEIKLKKTELKNLRETAEKINSSNFESDVISGGRANDCLSEIISRIVDFEKEIKDDEMKYIKIKREISEKINAVNDVVLKLILQKRYLDFMSMEQIAEYMNCSRSSVYQKYNLALEKIVDTFGHDCIVKYGDL